MIVWKLVIVAVVLLLPLAAGAAPAGKVIIAQGVDPTTLDMANQSESPASNVGRHIFDTLYERDQNLKIVPNLATEMPKFVPPTPTRRSSRSSAWRRARANFAAPHSSHRSIGSRSSTRTRSAFTPRSPGRPSFR